MQSPLTLFSTALHLSPLFQASLLNFSFQDHLSLTEELQSNSRPRSHIAFTQLPLIWISTRTLENHRKIIKTKKLILERYCQANQLNWFLLSLFWPRSQSGAHATCSASVPHLLQLGQTVPSLSPCVSWLWHFQKTAIYFIDSFSNWLWPMFAGGLCRAVLWEEPHWFALLSGPHQGTWCLYVLLLVVLALITWLRWDLPGFSAVVTLFPFVGARYLGGDTLRLYRYLVSASTFTH